MPELTDDLVDALNDVAPSLPRDARAALLAQAHAQLRSRPKVMANFPEALRKRALRIRRKQLNAELAQKGQIDPIPLPEVPPKPTIDDGFDIRALFAAVKLPFDERSVVDRAQRLHSEGLLLVPLQPGTKVPAIKWLDVQHHQLPLLQLKAHLSALGTDAGLAIVCGQISGLVVVDLDDASAVEWAEKHLPPTPWVTQTSRGQHWFYRYPTAALPTGMKLPWTGQLQADGRYVVAPGSLHPDGGRYLAKGDWTQPKSALPIFDLAWLIDIEALRRARERILRGT